ncbi:hypothetical protein [Massilia sp. SYSU DXS3249]
MYRAKATGRNRVAFFEISMQDEVEERLSIERDLALAIAAGQLEMFMQPQVNADGKTVGVNCVTFKQITVFSRFSSSLQFAPDFKELRMTHKDVGEVAQIDTATLQVKGVFDTCMITHHRLRQGSVGHARLYHNRWRECGQGLYA